MDFTVDTELQKYLSNNEYYQKILNDYEIQLQNVGSLLSPRQFNTLQLLLDVISTKHHFERESAFYTGFYAGCQSATRGG